MKYVIVSHNDLETPIIFPDYVPHSAFRNLQPISAGKCRISWNKENQVLDYQAYGKSVGLRLISRPEDANLIKQAFEFEMT